MEKRHDRLGTAALWLTVTALIGLSILLSAVWRGTNPYPRAKPVTGEVAGCVQAE